MPGVGVKTTKKLLACNIKTPITLIGQFMVRLFEVVSLLLCLCVHVQLASFLCAIVLQVLD